MAEPDNLILEHLRAIRATQAEHTDRLNRIELQLAAQGQQIGGLTTAVYGGHADLDALRRRIDRIERRLELSEAPP